MGWNQYSRTHWLADHLILRLTCFNIRSCLERWLGGWPAAHLYLNIAVFLLINEKYVTWILARITPVHIYVLQMYARKYVFSRFYICIHLSVSVHASDLDDVIYTISSFIQSARK